MIKAIAFHSNQLSVRGTEVAIFDYADYFEKLYGGRAIILTPQQAEGHDVRSAEKFAQRFKLLPYQSLEHLDQILRREAIDLLYCIKAGFNDGLVSKVCRTAVHAVFPHFEPHGDVYAYISSWLSREMKDLANIPYEIPYVPHIVSLPKIEGDLRQELGIPKSATVFGRYGGPETFDIGFVKELLPMLLERKSEIYFLFANTLEFCPAHPRIIHLDGFFEPAQKVKFIQTCDAMLHARDRGETFGLATAEFALLKRPVFTWSGSKEKAHIEHLGERAVLYDGVEDLAFKILSFKAKTAIGHCPYDQFSPEFVMKKFIQVFTLA